MKNNAKTWITILILHTFFHLFIVLYASYLVHMIHTIHENASNMMDNKTLAIILGCILINQHFVILTENILIRTIDCTIGSTIGCTIGWIISGTIDWIVGCIVG